MFVTDTYGAFLTNNITGTGKQDMEKIKTPGKDEAEMLHTGTNLEKQIGVKQLESETCEESHAMEDRAGVNTYSQPPSADDSPQVETQKPSQGIKRKVGVHFASAPNKKKRSTQSPRKHPSTGRAPILPREKALFKARSKIRFCLLLSSFS